MKGLCANTVSVALLLLLTGCGSGNRPTAAQREPVTGQPIKYARRFAMQVREGYTLLYLFGNRSNFDTTARFIVYAKGSSTRPVLAGYQPVESPCRQIAALSSIYASMLFELGAVDQLAAIDNIDYVVNPAIQARYQAGHLKELAKGPEIDLEQTILLKPDIVFTYGMGDSQHDLAGRLQRAGIPVAVSLDHLESSPLARAEWIKFYGVFCAQSTRADSIFALVEQRYLALKQDVPPGGKRPSVLSEIKYGDVWYVPGGRSFMAQLINDAGGDYVWSTDTSSGSLPLSFEEVFLRASEAEYWINLAGIRSKEALLSTEPRYAQFAAFKTDRIYNNDKVTNRLGYSTYWETGMIHPERILGDLRRLFRSTPATPADSLFYYRHIE